MSAPRIAVVSFPGNNCEVESIRSVKEAGMEAIFFRWNDDTCKLEDVDGYFLPGGFAYEDRGRSGMAAARDPVLEFIGREAAAGKVVIGNCNGAQVLVESGLIPLAQGLQMSLARNAIKTDDGWHAPGFLSEWVWVTPSCAPDRCATSNWSGVMHMPIAHGEGRFTTRDKDVLSELKKNKQIAFSYCDAQGKISDDQRVTPNGSVWSIAGICNPAGNVVALMPHPERTENGLPYFVSMRKWLERVVSARTKAVTGTSKHADWIIPNRHPKNVELFIETIITNNEERTVEQTARRYVPSLTLKQWKYFSISEKAISGLLRDLTVFNANKERAVLRRGSALTKWNAATKKEEIATNDVLQGIALLRRDIPDTGAAGLGKGSETGVCYVCKEIDESTLFQPQVLEVFCNPHASTLERIL